MREANYAILRCASTYVLLADEGPWDKYKTITNAAEEVVRELLERNPGFRGRRILYYDSEGELSELLHDNKQFTGFRCPKELPFEEHAIPKMPINGKEWVDYCKNAVLFTGQELDPILTAFLAGECNFVAASPVVANKPLYLIQKIEQQVRNLNRICDSLAILYRGNR